MPTGFSSNDWASYAQYYDTLNELRPYTYMLDDIIRAIGGSAREPFLDAGCGTANLTLRLLEQGGKAEITAIDSSPAMLDRARQKCSGRAAQFLEVDLDRELPFGNNTFGSVFCSNTLYALSDPTRTLREFFRVLRPSGLLVLTTPKRGYENGLILKAHCRSEEPDHHWQNAHGSPEREEALLREAMGNEEMVERFLWIARFNRQIARNGIFHFFTKEELSLLVRSLGFRHVRSRMTYAGQNILVIAHKRP